MPFEFATAGRILFGRGVLAEAGPLAASLGSPALVVTGHNADRAEPLLERLAARAVKAAPFSVDGEPTVQQVEAGLAQARQMRCQLVIGFGGGSALDAAKAIAILLGHDGTPLDYLEVIGRGKPLNRPGAPCIAIPTTAGTGTEVTRNAVLTSPEHRTKISLRSPHMLPAVALVDPHLTDTLPPDVTAATGLDAFTQLIEPYVSNRANPLIDPICRDGLQRVARSLRRAVADRFDTAARDDMALAALFGGLALANAGLGAVHGFAGPVGGMFGAPHGAVCGCLLPHVMAANVAALEAREPGSETLVRYREIAQILMGREGATSDDGIAWVQKLCTDLSIPRLADFGITKEDFPAIIDKATVSSSMQKNPIQLTSDQLAEVLTRAL